MTDYPLLCAARCRPVERGGPRRTHRAWVCESCADKARDKLRSIADSWGDLTDALSRFDSPGEEGGQRHGQVRTGLVINERVSQTISDVTAELWFYARVLVEERGATPPRNATGGDLARWISSWHMAHLTAHEDGGIALAFVDDCHRLARLVRNAAYPSGAKRVETGVRCTEHGTSDMGERVECGGSLYAVSVPGARSMPDLVCSRDETHRIDPATWSRPRWHRKVDAYAARRFLRALLTAHSDGA